MDKSTVRLRFANQTDIGRNPARIKNEDYSGQFEGEYGKLFIVCDGMGGAQGGEIASRLCVESVRNYFETNYLPGDERGLIAKAVDFAQDKILETVRNDPDLEGMGTTLVLLLIQEANYWFAHSGDSRIYLSRGGALNLLTKDHSEVQAMVDSGIITQEQAATHPQRNIITRAIGSSSYAPDISGPHKLQQDDVFLLCSDGLTEYVKDRELLQQMREEPMVACVNLVEMANERGGSDNITVQLIHVQQCSSFSLGSKDDIPVPRRKKGWPPVAVIGTVLIFLAAVVWYSLSLNKSPNQPGVKKAKTQIEERVAKHQKVKKTKKAKTPKKSKKAATQEIQTAQQTQPQANVLVSVDQKLQAGSAIESYLAMLDKISVGGPKLQLKFFTGGPENQPVYILPGQAIYINYQALQDKNSYNMSKDQIEALITLAVAYSRGKTPLTGSDWERKLTAPGTASIDETTYSNALALYSVYDEVNAKTLFNNDSRFGKYRNLIKAGTYNFIIDLPPKK